MFPIEIINKILVYVSELNNNMIITQYHSYTNKEYYMINFNSDLLWKIKATLRMKQLYPIYIPLFNKKTDIELYQHGIPHYQKQLQLMKS
jgi:hypothetical protein